MSVSSAAGLDRCVQREQVPFGLGRLPFVAFGMAAGLFIIALAFAASRVNSNWATPTFWVGQAVLYASPAALLLLRRPITRREAVGIAWLMPVVTYAITVAYSPVQFRFLDEFLTVRTAQSILATHHLFHPNLALAISPQYPGIEIVTTALASLSHLSIDASGTIVVGLAHLLLGLGIYFLMVEITRRPRIAALSVLVYSTGPHFQFFDSYFIYQTLALPLMVASLLAVVKMIRDPDWNTGLFWALIAVCCAGATVVTHHVTSYALLGFLLVLEVAQVLRRKTTRHDWRLLPIIFITAGLIVVWDIGIATATISYFAPTIQGLVPALPKRSAGPAAPAPSGPRFDLGLEYLSVLLLYLLVAVGAWRIWSVRRRARWSLAFPFALGSLSVLAALAVRVLTADGAELYGRMSTFFMIPAGLAVAVAIYRWQVPRLRRTRPRRRRRLGIRWWWKWIGVCAVVLLGIGGVAGGWPPYYARLPGAFRVEAWERSIDEHNLALASWAATELPPEFGVAADFQTASLLASLGHEAAPLGVAPLFMSSEFEPSLRKLVRKEGIGFVVVDQRMAQQPPADGAYFAPQSGVANVPIPARDLDKFNKIAGVSRIFEDGTMTVYALVGSLYTTKRTKAK